MSAAATREKQRIGQILLRRGFISEAQLERALARQTTTHQRLGALLIADGVVAEQDLALSLSSQAREIFTERRRRAAKLLAQIAEKQRAELERQTLDFINEWQQRVRRLQDRENGERKRREAALRLAMDFPRALIVAQERIGEAQRRDDANRLRRILGGLAEIERNFAAFRQAMTGASLYPLSEWIGRWQTLAEWAKDLQRQLV